MPPGPKLPGLAASVLTYGERPGMKQTELTQKLFYGHTA